MLKPKSTLHPQDLDRFYCAGIATILVLIAVLIAVWNNSIGSALFFSFLILGASLLITIVAFTTGILKHYDSFSYTLLNKVLPLIARRGAIKKDSRFYQQIKRLSDYHKTRLERIEPIVRAHPGIKNKLMGDLASAAHNAFKAMVYLCKSTFKTLKYALSYSITASITLSITLSTVAYIFLVKLLQLIGKHAQICYGKASEAINAEWVNAQRSFRRQARILVKKEHKVINKHLSLFESKCLIIKKDLKQAILRAAKIALTRSVALSLHIARILRYLALSLIVLFVVASISSFIIIVMVLHLMVGVSKRLFHVLLQVSIAIARTARILLVKARHNSYKAAIKSYRSFRRLEIARYRKEQKERFQIPDILSAIPNKKVVPVTFLVIFAVLGIFMLSSQFSLTGFVVYDPISNNNPLNLTLNESQEYEFNLEEGLTSLALSGSIEGTGLVKVYIEHNKSRILVLDSRKMVQDTGGLINLVEPSLASPSIIKDSKNKSININLGYRSGTPYDMDDDGHESLTGIVDISVENTSFNWEVDQSKLCTRWEIYSENSENSTTICNGNEQCCNFVDLAPSSDTWNGIFNLYHGLYGTTDNNTVSAQILYVDFNLTAETPYSDISSSEWQSLPASFSETITRFDKVCEESCAMNRISNSTIKMIFEMQDASITLDWITYKALLILPETISPPILVQDIPNIIVYKDSTAAIDLKKYFKDDDTEYLNYTVNDMENISISIFNNTLEIRPDTNFTGTAFTFITANDSKNIAVSNLFAIEVKTRPLPKEHLQQQPLVILGQPVKWVKKVTVDQPVDNISINVTSDAANITIKKKDKGVEQFVEKQNIKIDYKGDTTTLENYETTKKVEKIDKEIDSLNKKKRTLIPDNKAVRETNIEIIGLKEQKNLITGAVVYDTGQEGIITGDTNQEGMLARFFNWLFTKLDSSITGAVVMEIGEEEYNTTTITIEDELEELEIEYYTDGPTSEETTLSGSTKQVTISSDIHYENILAFTSIRDTPASLIKIFWMVNDTNTLVQPYNLTDTNNNGLIDTVYWLVPHLSNQTYQIIIEISKAEHLDSNRTLIADIYDYVKARDNNFTTISNGEYVRVTFEVPLDSTRDITIYARGNGSILVYEYEGNETVAFFNSIDEEKEYKVYLTNLIGTQDTFDLRISGSIEFDYIVDPLSSESESADEWKTFGRYLNHTHYTSSYAPPNISDTTTVTKDTGSNQFVYPTGVIANDTLFFGTVGGFFYAINASNVSQVINIRDFKEEAGWSDADITDFPAATDDSVYVFVYHDSKDAVLYQLNISNINQTLSKNEDLGSNDAYKEGPVVYNGNVYMVDHYDDKIYQYNASNVSLTIATNDISSSSCDTMPAIANDYLYIGCDDNQMHQLNASNVSQLFETYTTGGDIDSTPAVAGGYLYFGSDDNVIYQLNASNISQQIANYTTGGDVNGNPGVGNGYVYIGSDDFSFYQLNASNISQQIANYTGTTSFPRHSAINDRYVFALSGNNILQLDANNVNNKIAEVVSIHRSNRGPLIAGGYVYLGGGLNQDINQFGTFYPTTILESPIAGLELGSSLQNETFNCSSSDSIGVLNISLYITDINNGSFGLNQTLEVSGTHTAANWTLELDEGNYTWNCLSYDTNNNSDWGVNRTIILDGSSPTITIDAPSNNTFTTDSGLDVTYTAADQNIDSCWYSNDTMGVNTSLASCSTDITDITWTESQHNVTIWANDTKNNVGSSEILFTIDISYPSFTNISNLTAEYATALIFDINATDTTSFDCFKINDTGNFSINCAGSLENNSMLDIMLYWLNVTINDSAGNENSSVIWINVTDTTAPTFTTIANQSVYDLDALGYDIEATDAQNVDCFTINDTDHFKINCSGYLENSTLLNATLYWLNVTINDTTNNTNNEPMFVNVSVKPFFGLDLDYPTANISVTPNTFFNITVNVSCQRGDCDDVNVSLYDTGSNISDVRVAFVCYSASCSDADDLSDYLIDQGFQVTQNRYTSWTDETLNDSAFDVIVVGGNYLVGYYAFDSASDPARDAFEDEAIPTVVALDSGYTGNRMGITSSTTCTTDYSDNDIIDIQTHDIMTGFSGTVYVDTTGDDLCYFTAAQMTDPYTKLFAPEDAGSANIAGYVIDKGDATTGTNPGTLVYLGFDTADTYPDTTGNDSTIIKQATCWAATGSSDCKPLKLVNNTAGATPFYTNITNPYNTTLSNDSSEIVTWWVNASGDSGTLGEFLVHTNKTSDMSIGNITSVWNVTIDSSVDTILPSFDDIDNQTIEYGIALDHDINASDDIAVDCFTVNDTSNFQINCSGYLENNTILNVAVYDLNISVNDTSNNTNYSIIWVNVTADVSPPEFTNMDNQTIDFGSILGYDINATDPNNLSCFEVNDTTTFQINCTGFLENITALSIATYWLNITVNDTLGYNTSDIIFVNVTDGSAPTFTNINNESLELGVALTQDINATDDVAVDCFTVNDTTNFQINCSGFLENITALGAVFYTLKISINDTSNNTNSTVFSVNVTDTIGPAIDFVSPTLDDESSLSESSIEINVSITEENLKEVIYDWNGTNYTYYNDSLVLMLNFDNITAIGDNYSQGTNNKTVDMSKYLNNGTLHDVTYNSTSPYGSGFEFDGSGGFIDVGNDPSLNLGPSFTLSVWTYVFVHDNDYSFLITKDGAAGGSYDLGFKNSKPYVAINDGSWGEYVADSELNTHEWHHILGVRDADDNVHIYVDGVINKSFSSTKTPQTVTTNVYLGRRVSTDYEHNGVIDEPRIWNVSLSATEVYQQYASNLKRIDADRWELYVNQSLNSTNGLTAGDYDYQVFASDIYSNSNNTEQRNVTIDAVAPTFTNISNQTAEFATAFTYEINATDDVAVDCFTVNDTSNFQINCSGYLENITALGIRTYWLNISINDTANNTNALAMWVNVTDTIAPSFTAIANQTIEYASALTYDINATDASNISCFTVNDTTSFQINCSGYLENNTVLDISLYWLNITINDTSNNTNSSEMMVNVSDTVTPTINTVTVAPTTGTSGTAFNITVNATDNYNISTVTAYLQKPDENTTENITLELNNGLYNGTWNSSNNSVGTYLIDIVANDTSGNEKEKENGAVIALASYSVNASINSSVEITANTSVIINDTNTTETWLKITTNITINASVAIAKYSDNTKAVDPTSVTELGKYIDIVVDNTTNQNISSATVRIYYTDDEINDANLQESTLRLYKYNENSSAWDLTSPGGVETALNYVWGNVTSFSSFGVFGTELSESSSDPSTTAATETSQSRSKCSPKWDCSGWSDCSPSGIQTRSCSRQGSCMSGSKPSEKKKCKYKRPEEFVKEKPIATEEPTTTYKPGLIGRAFAFFKDKGIRLSIPGILFFLAIIIIFIVMTNKKKMHKIGKKHKKIIKKMAKKIATKTASFLKDIRGNLTRKP